MSPENLHFCDFCVTQEDYSFSRSNSLLGGGGAVDEDRLRPVVLVCATVSKLLN